MRAIVDVEPVAEGRLLEILVCACAFARTAGAITAGAWNCFNRAAGVYEEGRAVAVAS